MSKPNNVLEFQKEANFQGKTTLNISDEVNALYSVKRGGGGTIDEKEESIMPENNTYTKTEIDLKFQILEQKIDGLPTAFENMLLRNNELLEAKANERQKESSNRLKWFIGIIISLASIGVSIAQHFLSK